MTLFEALVALVILGLSAVGYLEVFQGSTRSARASEQWIQASARVQAAMEQAIAARERGMVPPPDSGVRIETVPWRGAVDDVIATAQLPDGQVLRVHRLARSR